VRIIGTGGLDVWVFWTGGFFLDCFCAFYFRGGFEIVRVEGWGNFCYV